MLTLMEISAFLVLFFAIAAMALIAFAKDIDRGVWVANKLIGASAWSFIFLCISFALTI